jgi:hypothetical protein
MVRGDRRRVGCAKGVLRAALNSRATCCAMRPAMIHAGAGICPALHPLRALRGAHDRSRLPAQQRKQHNRNQPRIEPALQRIRHNRSRIRFS